MLQDKKLSLSEIVKEINFKSSISKRYDAMNLLLNIAGSDDRLSKEEDKLLNNIARALELDLNRFQEMKTSTIANIETIDQSDVLVNSCGIWAPRKLLGRDQAKPSNHVRHHESDLRAAYQRLHTERVC